METVKIFCLFTLIATIISVFSYIISKFPLQSRGREKKNPFILQVKFMSMNITTEQKDGQINKY